MAGRDIIIMNTKELKRLHIIHKALDKKITQVEAATIIGLTDRHIRRIIRRVHQEGDTGIIHRSRGRPSNRRLPVKLKKRVIDLYRQKYPDFGPTLASEKLLEIDKIKINDETLRNWLIEDGAWQISRGHRRHRQWRQRKRHFGEMIQVDGSHHDWFEARAPEPVFMGYVDDATNTVFGRFYEYEGTIPAMDSFKRYIRKYGIPHSVYIDKHTTYKSTAKPTIEDELDNKRPLSQFERALEELGVEIIHANSPQAKGRIERLFKTFQDRLIKEMRLRGIKTVEGANRFLNHYLPGHNKRFSFKPVEEVDLHRAIPQGLDLDKILCIKTKRALRNDFTINHDKKLYQILDHIRAKDVIVEEKVNGTMLIKHNDKSLKYKEIAQRSKKDRPKVMVRKVYRPPMDHPLKKPMYERRLAKINTYSQKEKGAQKEKELLLTKT